jgi:hypothetical protein
MEGLAQWGQKLKRVNCFMQVLPGDWVLNTPVE